jgi:hypothetical protein
MDLFWNWLKAYFADGYYVFWDSDRVYDLSETETEYRMHLSPPEQTNTSTVVFVKDEERGPAYWAELPTRLTVCKSVTFEIPKVLTGG